MVVQSQVYKNRIFLNLTMIFHANKRKEKFHIISHALHVNTFNAVPSQQHIIITKQSVAYNRRAFQIAFTSDHTHDRYWIHIH